VVESPCGSGGNGCEKDTAELKERTKKIEVDMQIFLGFVLFLHILNSIFSVSSLSKDKTYRDWFIFFSSSRAKKNDKQKFAEIFHFSF